MTLEEARDRVRRGAEWLDRTAPGWEHRLDYRSLDIASHCNCVLGQLGLWCHPERDTHTGDAPLGFIWSKGLPLGSDEILTECTMLTLVWKELIYDRRLAPIVTWTHREAVKA